MQLIVNNSSMIPIYEQLMEQIKSKIVDKTLSNGEALPSVRGLAKELKISALTVKKTYDLLEQEGYISTVHGKGSYVNDISIGMIMEENKKAIEKEFSETIEKAKLCGLTESEIKSLFFIILEE